MHRGEIEDVAKRFVNANHVMMETHLAQAELQRLREHRQMSEHLMKERKGLAPRSSSQDAEIEQLKSTLASREQAILQRDEVIKRCREEMFSGAAVSNNQRSGGPTPQTTQIQRLADALAARSEDIMRQDQEIQQHHAEVERFRMEAERCRNEAEQCFQDSELLRARLRGYQDQLGESQGNCPDSVTDKSQIHTAQDLAQHNAQLEQLRVEVQQSHARMRDLHEKLEVASTRDEEQSQMLAALQMRLAAAEAQEQAHPGGVVASNAAELDPIEGFPWDQEAMPKLMLPPQECTEDHNGNGELEDYYQEQWMKQMAEVDAQRTQEVEGWKAKLAEAEARNKTALAEAEDYWENEWNKQMAEVDSQHATEVNALKDQLASAQAGTSGGEQTDLEEYYRQEWAEQMAEIEAQQAKEIEGWRAKLADSESRKETALAEAEDQWEHEWNQQTAEADSQHAKEVEAWKAKLADLQTQKDKELAALEDYYQEAWGKADKQAEQKVIADQERIEQECPALQPASGAEWQSEVAKVKAQTEREVAEFYQNSWNEGMTKAHAQHETEVQALKAQLADAQAQKEKELADLADYYQDAWKNADNHLEHGAHKTSAAQPESFDIDKVIAQTQQEVAGFYADEWNRAIQEISARHEAETQALKVQLAEAEHELAQLKGISGGQGAASTDSTGGIVHF